MASTVGLVLGSSGVSGLTGRVRACCPVTVGVVMVVLAKCVVRNDSEV